MKSRVIWSCAILMAAAVVAFSQQLSQQPGPPPQPRHPAQHPPRPSGPPPQAPAPPQPVLPHPHDPIAGNLFPPEVVMQHRREIGLTDEQRATIRGEALKASTRFTELQWQMQDEMETMATLMKSPNVDEQKALAQLDKVLNIEREVKRAQLELSIRIKNTLTPEQQMKLHELRGAPHPPR